MAAKWARVAMAAKLRDASCVAMAAKWARVAMAAKLRDASCVAMAAKLRDATRRARSAGQKEGRKVRLGWGSGSVRTVVTNMERDVKDTCRTREEEGGGAPWPQRSPAEEPLGRGGAGALRRGRGYSTTCVSVGSS